MYMYMYSSLIRETDLYLRVGNGRESLLLEFFNGLLVIPEIQLRAHQYDGCVGTVVAHFRVPLMGIN